MMLGAALMLEILVLYEGALVLIQVKVLQVNLEERDSLEWTGLLQTLVSSIAQKPGKLSDQGRNLLIGG